MIDDTLLEAEEKMERAVEHAKEEFAAIRTGRANAAMFSKIIIDYYGSPTPLTQMASVGTPSRGWPSSSRTTLRSSARWRRRSATPTSG
ncbi:hypothetical protein Pflav_086460 [Phytohabitans flavus]|uniref:Ribosome recycling factor domain-containing protein n=1 Tax=Phytohabitans flavus TaxID=1076124 RepID=A0A6F8Y7Z9_9ACTN|nr:hypothetical protein Pflav_086460 [Phytohabitans flavus]